MARWPFKTRSPLHGRSRKRLSVAPWVLWASAVNKDGSIVLPLALPDAWFWPLGVVDINTGRTRVLDLGLNDGDMAGG